MALVTTMTVPMISVEIQGQNVRKMFERIGWRKMKTWRLNSLNTVVIATVPTHAKSVGLQK